MTINSVSHLNTCNWLLSTFINLFLQIELAGQKEALDTEHCKTLEILKNQVFTPLFLNCIGLQIPKVSF